MEIAIANRRSQKTHVLYCVRRCLLKETICKSNWRRMVFERCNENVLNIDPVYFNPSYSNYWPLDGQPIPTYFHRHFVASSF